MIKLTVRQIKLNKDIDIGKYRYLDYWKNKRKERNVDGYIEQTEKDSLLEIPLAYIVSFFKQGKKKALGYRCFIESNQRMS